MNSKPLIVLLALLATVAGPLSHDALARPGKGGEAPGRCDERGEHQLERLAVLLELSAAQRAEAETVLNAGREERQALHEKLRQGREALRQAALVIPYDEAKIRSLAAEQTKLQTEMIVARARQQNQLHALLTPEQQTRAAALKQQLGDGRGHRNRNF